jgi:hypothetical protein
MRERSTLHAEFVEFIPEKLDEGQLYVSRRYRTASHLCCCGCGTEVVTPLNPAKWHLTEHADGSVSLMPSIGNWSLPCKSHYFVSRNCIQWAGAFTSEQIAAVKLRDRHDVAMQAGVSTSRWSTLVDAIHRGWREFVALLTSINR